MSAYKVRAYAVPRLKDGYLDGWRWGYRCPGCLAAKHCHPATVIREADRHARRCLDLRELNNQTKEKS